MCVGRGVLCVLAEVSCVCWPRCVVLLFAFSVLMCCSCVVVLNLLCVLMIVLSVCDLFVLCEVLCVRVRCVEVLWVECAV
jgi:hypothetical protein